LLVRVDSPARSWWKTTTMVSWVAVSSVRSSVRRVCDLAAGVLGDGQTQRANRGGLVACHQDSAELGTQCAEDGPQVRFAVGRSLVVDGFTGRCQTVTAVVALPTSRLR
jgi:hypothetical protein